MAGDGRLRTGLRWLGAAGALAVGAALLFSFLGPVLPLADSVAHFRFHLLGALAAGAVLLLAVGAPRPAAAAVATGLLVAFTGLRPALPNAEPAPSAAPQLALLQLNLRYDNHDHAAVLALIAREKPDLIAFQEVSRRNLALLDALQAEYPHQQVCRFAGVGGAAVLSRFAMTEGGCAGNQGLAWLRAETPQGPVTAASLHLHWPYPFSQAQQIDRLAPEIAALPRPVLLGGDFNAAPWSHSADRIAQASGARVLGGLRFTYRGRPLSFAPEIPIPIDHILADLALAPTEISVSGPVGSDHRAVLARLAWR